MTHAAEPITVYGMSYGKSVGEMIQILKERGYSCNHAEIVGDSAPDFDSPNPTHAECMDDASMLENGYSNMEEFKSWLNKKRVNIYPDVIEMSCGVWDLCDESVDEVVRLMSENLNLVFDPGVKAGSVPSRLGNFPFVNQFGCVRGEAGDKLCVETYGSLVGSPDVHTQPVIRLFKERYGKPVDFN